jgi:predicted dehydrogenase
MRIGFLSVAHMHAYGYAPALAARQDAVISGVWDDDPTRATAFAVRFNTKTHADPNALLAESDAVVICSENKRHAEMIEWAARAGTHVLCEKPLVTTMDEADRVRKAADSSGIVVMTSFPCRYSPAFARLVARVTNGDIGEVKAICSTNHGMCPFGWFVEQDKSGGGAMMDHTVHVADLLRALLHSEPTEVYAQTGNNMYSQEWDDTAMLHIKFANGVFASLDASWSRPKGYKTWGDVKMNVVGEKGVIELDLFAQAFDVYTDHHWLAGYGSGLDDLLIEDFITGIHAGKAPISVEDGIAASKIAIAGYESAKTGQPISVS